MLDFCTVPIGPKHLLLNTFQTYICLCTWAKPLRHSDVIHATCHKLAMQHESDAYIMVPNHDMTISSFFHSSFYRAQLQQLLHPPLPRHPTMTIARRPQTAVNTRVETAATETGTEKKCLFCTEVWKIPFPGCEILCGTNRIYGRPILTWTKTWWQMWSWSVGVSLDWVWLITLPRQGRRWWCWRGEPSVSLKLMWSNLNVVAWLLNVLSLWTTCKIR